MGFVELLSDAGDYFKERWGALTTAYGNAWANTVPENAEKFWSGVTTFAMAPQRSPQDYGRGVRLFLDGALGMAGGILTGTIGGLFEAPGLNEIGGALEAAYRWSWARPQSAYYMTIANAALVADDARKRGQDPLSAYMSSLWTDNMFRGDTRFWGDEVGRVTPGQAMVWNVGGFVGAINPGNAEDPYTWLRTKDPRTPEGQAMFNSPEASTLLKYTSGSVDFLSNLIADPGHGAAIATGTALSRARHTSNASYIMRGGLEREIGSKDQNTVWDAAVKAKTPEELRRRAFPNAYRGADAALPLWAAAQKGDRALFDNAYLVSRGITDIKGELGSRAWGSIQADAPDIFRAFADIFANWNISDASLNLGKREDADYFMSELALNDYAAFENAIANKQGAWGRLEGSLFRVAQPKVGRWDDVREGVHWKILHGSPITVVRPFQKAARAAMPSQGTTPLLDLEDGTTIALQQFRAMVERTQGMDAERVNYWASLWGSQGTREGRGRVYLNFREEAIRKTAEANGLDAKTVEAALPEIGRYQSAAQGFIEKQQIYISERAAQLGATNMARHVPNEAKSLRDAYKATSADRKGEFGKTAMVLPNIDGQTVLIELPDSKIMPALAPDPKKAQMLSQTAKWMPTIDFRALDSQLKYWKWIHRPEPGVRGMSLAAVARTKAAWDGTVTALDFVNMVWKSSALFRPAQIMRNIADDIHRRILVLDKLPFLMQMAQIPRRTFQNTFSRVTPDGKKIDGRARLMWDMAREVATQRRVQRAAIVRVDGGWELASLQDRNQASGAIGEATGAIKANEMDRAAELYEEFEFGDIGHAWVDGHISWKMMDDAMQAWAAHPRKYDVLGDAYTLVRQFQQGSFDRLPSDLATGQGDKFQPQSGPSPEEVARAQAQARTAAENLRRAVEVIVGNPSMAKAADLAGELGVPFGDASNLIDQLQARGIIGPPKMAERDREGRVIRQGGDRDVLLDLDDALARLTDEAESQAGFERFLGNVSEQGVGFLRNRPEDMMGAAAREAALEADSNNRLGLSQARFALYQHLFGGFDEFVDKIEKGMGKIALTREFKRKLLYYYLGRRNEQPHFLGTSKKGRGGTVLNVAKYLEVLVEQHLKKGLIDEQGRLLTNETDNYDRGRIVIDPIAGTTRTDTPIDQYTQIAGKVSERVIKAGTKKVINASAALRLENYILDNLDHLLEYDKSLILSVEPTGDVRMGIVRLKPEAVKTFTKVKKTAFGKMKDFNVKDIIDAGHEAIYTELPNGNRVRISLGAFVGEENEAYRHRVSAQSGTATANMLTGEFSQNRLMREAGGYSEIEPTDRSFNQAWERVVNGQIAGDPVARMFLQGATVQDAIQWLQNTRNGTKWIKRMQHLGAHYVMQVDTIKAMVDTYVPYRNTDEGRALRQAVLARVANRKHLDDAVPLPEQHAVHGFSVDYLFGRSAAFHRVAGAINSVQRWMFDMPTDKLSRFPFFAESYRRHLNELVSLKVRSTKPKVVITDDDGIQKVPVQKMADEDFFTDDDLMRYDRMARDRAFFDTRYYLYDVAQMNDLARMFRFIVPFSSAIMDSYIKYGRIIKNNPAVVLQGLYYWEMFERNETVQDDNGYILRKDAQGNEHWYSRDPSTGDFSEVPKYGEDPTTGERVQLAGKHRYTIFRLPSELGNLVGKKLYGVEMNPGIAINKESFNVFIDLPSTGPLVAIPVNQFALANPEFGESKAIQKFVLPFGPTTNSAHWIPANVRTLWGQFDAEDGNTAEGQAKAIYQAELISYARNERDEPPSFTEVREKAAMLRSLRFMNSWFSPASFQFQSPYQPYVDAYRQLATQDPASADERFLAQHGDEFYAVAMTVSRNNAGIRATLDSHKSFLRHKGLVEQFPELAGLIVGQDGGPFSKAVYEAQKQLPLRAGSNQKVREIMTLDESAQELEKRRVWDDYSKLMDMIRSEMVDLGITSLRNRRAAHLVKLRDEFIAKNKYWDDPASGKPQFSPWYNDFTAVDHAQIDKRIESLWTIVQDPDLQNREDIRGLVEYLSMREWAQEEMRAIGVSTLNNQKARRIRDRWDSSVHGLVEENPEFAVLWARWLSQDDELTIGGGASG